MSEQTKIFSVQNAPVLFQGGAHAFEFPGCEFEPGHIYHLTGQNGAGKSTLLRHIELIYSKQVSLLLLDQNYSSLIFPYHTVKWNVVLPHIVKNTPAVERDRIYDSIMSRFGLVLDGSRMARRLSGGEQRLVVLARFRIASPDIILLDEPVANLDTQRVELVWDFVIDLARQGSVVIVVSHEKLRSYETETLWKFDGVDGKQLSIARVNYGRE